MNNILGFLPRTRVEIRLIFFRIIKPGDRREGSNHNLSDVANLLQAERLPYKAMFFPYITNKAFCTVV